MCLDLARLTRHPMQEGGCCLSRTLMSGDVCHSTRPPQPCRVSYSCYILGGQFSRQPNLGAGGTECLLAVLGAQTCKLLGCSLISLSPKENMLGFLV